MRAKRSTKRAAATTERESRVEIHIPSDAEFVRVVRLALAGIASRLPFSYDEIEDIKLAVSEACNNAIQHASAGANGNGRVIVECVSSPSRLVVNVQDHGPGIKPASIRKSRKPDSPEEGGLGMYLMQALMDEVHYEGSPDAGTRVRLVKYVNRS